jgi:hypothetical protein
MIMDLFAQVPMHRSRSLIVQRDQELEDASPSQGLPKSNTLL